MQPLLDKFKELEDLLCNHRRTLAQNTGVPFVRLVYQPEEAAEVTRRLETLQRTLARDGVPVESVSCRGVIFEYYEQRGRLQQLFTLEQEDPKALARNIAKRARQVLTARILDAAGRLPGDGVIFLVDTAFVYPYFQLGPVLDACTNVIVAPLALVALYPGTVDGGWHGHRNLLFLGQRPSGYYRARTLM